MNTTVWAQERTERDQWSARMTQAREDGNFELASQCSSIGSVLLNQSFARQQRETAIESVTTSRLSWANGTDLIQAEARLDVYSEVMHIVHHGEEQHWPLDATVALIEKEVVRNLIGGAAGAHSTNALSNVIDEARTAVWADVARVFGIGR